MAAAVLELFPDAKLGIGPAIKDGFYYDFDLPRPLTPADLEQIEAKMREQQAADLRFERSRDLPRAEAIDLVRERKQPFKVEIIEDLPESEGPTVSFYRHGDFEDLCRGGHLGSTKELGAVQAAQHRRRVLARRRDAPDAPAHLRHRLGDAGGARPAPVARRGGEEARPPQARPRARPLHLPSRVAGRAVPPPARHGPLAVARGLVAPGPPRGRLPRGPHAEPRAQGAVGDLAATGTTTRTTCSSSTTTTMSPG